MDPGCISVSVCVMMACLLGAAALSSGDNTSCPCPQIPPRELCKLPQEGCYQIDGRYRYECVDGYVRKVGTSALTRCREDGQRGPQWIKPSLECIPDPNRPIPPTTPPPPTPPPNTAATTTPTSQQTTWNTSISVSEDGGTDSVEPTTPGEEDSGTPTTEEARPMQNATFSPGTASSSTTSPPGANKGKLDSVTQTQGIQTSTVSQSNANRSTTTSPGVHKAATPTRLQTTVTASSFSSVTGQRGSVDGYGNINSVTQTVVKSQTGTSTISPSTHNNSNISPPGAIKGDVAQTVGITALLVIVCTAVGIGFFLYRRRSKTTDTHSHTQPTQEELMPMNC